MLEKMQGINKSPDTNTVFTLDPTKSGDIANQYTSTPKPKPASDMEQVLINSLKANLGKDYSPME
ncbi:hypothetical protein [Legionella worsleiensis]|nr:hypothetical protein [Legionella worsleiensis]